MSAGFFCRGEPAGSHLGADLSPPFVVIASAIARAASRCRLRFLIDQPAPSS
jgi:hypothetical protein